MMRLLDHAKEAARLLAIGLTAALAAAALAALVMEVLA